jgi:Icc-related predicted phosphoesterase
VKILIVADKESKALWDYYTPGMLDEYDLILSCGDLAPQYLSFLATFTKAPVLYVHGNHDDCYEQTPPEGCTCIENMVYRYKGLRILGLGGSMRYKPGINQYTEAEMSHRIRGLRFRIFRNNGFDILLSHAPAQGLGDADDMPHHGFLSFVHLMDKYHPKYMIHGHVHANYTRNLKRISSYGDTQIVNGYDRYVLEIPDEEIARWEEESPKKKRHRGRKRKDAADN